MSKIQAKIKVLMDDLQNMMEQNLHLTNEAAVINQLDRCGLYIAHMTDEDKDYFQAAQWVVEDGEVWNKN